MIDYIRSVATLFMQPIRLARTYPLDALRADLFAGITVGLVLLPQGLAFAILAGLPPIVGLYSAMTATIVGALWGSSSHLNSGPSTTGAILTLSVLLPIAPIGSEAFVLAASMIAVMAGVIRLLMGIARLGMLVTFISDAVAVGFTAGSGLLIFFNQIGPIVRISISPGAGIPTILAETFTQLAAIHWPSLAIGATTIALIYLIPRITRKLPAALLSMAIVTIITALFGAEQYGIRLMGDIPPGFPPLANLPIFDLNLIGQLANGALALAIIGLVEAIAIGRAIAGYTGQRIDSNQEFVGQGLANIVSGIFSGMPCSGSFNRSALAYQAGGKTALTAIISGVTVLLGTAILSDVLEMIPRPAIAGTLMVASLGMVDRQGMVRIWRGSRGEAVIMVVTLALTLTLPLQFAILIGVLMSLGYYLLRTATPRVEAVVPDPDFRHWESAHGRPTCPQLLVVDLQGDLYFGAVNHVEEHLVRLLDHHPSVRFMLLRMHSVNQCDVSGIRALDTIRRILRVRGGDLYFVRVRASVMYRMQISGFYEQLGPERFLDEDKAIEFLFHRVLDPAVCIYECDRRVFRECQELPKQTLPGHLAIPLLDGKSPAQIAPRPLWEALHSPQPPLVIDVREPREFQRGHIPGARNIPLSRLIHERDAVPAGPVVLVCRSGRRSMRAAALLAGRTPPPQVLEGGMLAWAAANLLEAVEQF
ncbi:SulP family inorganic anion transporter [uncultured Chloroflexus sp.]|uniref:SulP family inorganic anion transporter n=2 Tax=uncultured Chloroflexus sp. TaxID=214040 RepID=UPI0026361FD2|nr:SulP family inorganic anion transporter [uncultured Chloroflexus sp.]